ncbi:restriction endonuclease subunit S [Buttiauxella selenatireducens]|uniref:Restriction endonuclease subunit S n=1 Tax=Buttiauxella selenatireducens TaxID=3073902 RepID=A0ABY9SHQ9_9ENTR|nr:restriction endonuclease subunit S [Buttiauxella sp. R73]WMY75592.1 restriction endonuclease subunit S [Buttiauxella sp. R73]
MAVEKLITDHFDTWTSALQTRSTAGRGSNGKIDLYGIKKLRELILELAVRGKLVPQDPNDEPASELLKRIAAEKAELVKQGKIKKQKPLPEISEDEKPFELPKGWEWVHLPDIYYSISDSSNKIKSSEILPEGRYPVIEQSQEFISGYCNDEHLLIKIDNPVVVFGDHTRNIKFIDFDFVVGADGVKILSPVLTCERYFFWQLRSLKLEVRGYARHFKVLNSQLFALPPFAEQERIVEKIYSLMSLCDQLEQQSLTSLDAHSQLVETLLATLTDSQNAEELAESWARISQHFDTLFTTEASIDALKQTILQLAVMGKLVPQDPNDEPAAELLKRIEQEKTQLVKEGKIKKQKPLPPVSDEEKPFELPQGWEWCRIGDYSLSTEYGISHKTFKATLGVPVLKMGDIQNGDVILGGQQVVDADIDELPYLYLEKRDVLYNRTNSAELVGKSGVYLGEDNVYTYASYLIRIRTIKEKNIPEFLNLNMQAPFFRLTQINPHVKQQCGQANVNGTIMKNMVIAVAPIKEQERVIQKVVELCNICDHLKSRLQSAQQTQLHLADALTESALN